MKYSREEVMQYIMEDDVKFIRLAFCDVFGKQKNISIMPNELAIAFEKGIVIDASAIIGFDNEITSDLVLHPDPDTLMPLPWRPEHGKVVRMFCNITYPDGSVFESDTREVLKKAISDAKELGYEFSFGSKQEFYLFNLDENMELGLILEPYDKAGYMDIAPEDKGENIRREICLTLEQMGIQPKSSYHKEGPGQNEINFNYSDPLSAADNALTFQTVVKTVARRNGLYADFSPKPLLEKTGNGFHIIVSVQSEDNEDCTNCMIAGILDKIKDMTVFLNPHKNSYKRFGISKAPKYISWSSKNRSHLVRVPANNETKRYIELRSPDPLANPYLAFALIIYASLYGINNKLKLQPETDININKIGSRELEKLDKLPNNLKKASEIAKNSDFIKTHIESSLIEMYCNR